MVLAGMSLVCPLPAGTAKIVQLGFDCLLTFTGEFTYSYVFTMLISILPFQLAFFEGP